MADEEKVYYPETIEDTPFPQAEGGNLDISQAIGKGVYGPQTIKDRPMPTKRVAVELLSSALNTKSKKILQEFQFTPSGALQIGKYQNGVSGDLRISPSGILGRNLSGITTFAIDADNGDAIFLGTLQAGTIIAGDTNIVMETASNGAGRIVLLNGDIPAILIGDPS